MYCCLESPSTIKPSYRGQWGYLPHGTQKTPVTKAADNTVPAKHWTSLRGAGHYISLTFGRYLAIITYLSRYVSQRYWQNPYPSSFVGVISSIQSDSLVQVLNYHPSRTFFR